MGPRGIERSLADLVQQLEGFRDAPVNEFGP